MEGYETMFRKYEDRTAESNRREIAAQHHRQAKRYKLMSLIEGHKGHLATERPGDNHQELLDSLAYYQAELCRLDSEPVTTGDRTVVRFRHRNRERAKG
jgi:hypothetical protein